MPSSCFHELSVTNLFVLETFIVVPPAVYVDPHLTKANPTNCLHSACGYIGRADGVLSLLSIGGKLEVVEAVVLVLRELSVVGYDTAV